VELVAAWQLRDGPAPAAAEHRIQADGARRGPGRLQIHCLPPQRAPPTSRATDGRARARTGGGEEMERGRNEEGVSERNAIVEEGNGRMYKNDR
jgi:hypothetical protein